MLDFCIDFVCILIPNANIVVHPASVSAPVFICTGSPVSTVFLSHLIGPCEPTDITLQVRTCHWGWPCS